jgi:dUTPase
MSASQRLFIAPISKEFAELYRNAADAYNRTPDEERNSGFDLYCDIRSCDNIGGSILVSQGCRAVAVDMEGRYRAFWLAPRSSISKTCWRLANSIGLIDATYRGIIKAALYGTDTVSISELSAQRVCQLATGDLLPWKEVIVVDELPAPATLRGEGGFGSTGAT